jgi:hypothetical protein
MCFDDDMHIGLCAIQSEYEILNLMGNFELLKIDFRDS